MKTPDQVMSAAKLRLIAQPNSVFLTTILFQLKFEWTDEHPTAATDGVRLLVNSDWFCQLDLDAQVFVLAHETFHVAYQHMLRVQNRDKRLYNVAADYVINDHLILGGYRMGNANGLHDYQYRGMTSEEVYELLDEDDVPQDFESDLQDPGDSDSTRQIEQQVDQILVQAQIASERSGQDIGSIPAEIRRHIEELLNPKLPWNEILAKHLENGLGKQDYVFSRPNRRYLPDFYLPSLTGGGDLERVTIAIDTSGSITQNTFNEFLTETTQIIFDLNPQSVELIQFDSFISGIDEIESPDQLFEVEFKGGGGTNITDVYKYLSDNPTNGLIIFTDGYIRPHPNLAPKIPIYWVYTETNKYLEEHESSELIEMVSSEMS